MNPYNPVKIVWFRVFYTFLGLGLLIGNEIMFSMWAVKL